MNLESLAKDRGYIVEEVSVALGDGRTRPGWLVLDEATQSFVAEAVNWTSADAVEAYIRDSS